MKKCYLVLCNNNYPLVVRIKKEPEIKGQVNSVIKISFIEYLILKKIKQRYIKAVKPNTKFMELLNNPRKDIQYEEE